MSDLEAHWRKLEKLYLAAPVNEFYRPVIRIEEGRAEIRVDVQPHFLHAAGAVHGSVCFKLLDDACFFAVNSLVEDVFVLTASFNLHLVRPVDRGTMTGVGRIVHSSRRLFLAEGEVLDDRGRMLARGGGSFMRSAIRLDERVGYEGATGPRS